MAIYVNDFSVWVNGVPLVVMGADPDFGTWENLVPVVDVDESNPNSTDKRRRAQID
jgi:hypothetical protein